MFIIFLFGAASQSWAQGIRFASEPDSFFVDLEKAFKNGRQLDVVPEIDSFSTAWNNFDAVNKTRFIRLIQEMAKRRQSITPSISSVMKMFTAADAREIGQTKMGQLLFVTWRTFLYKPNNEFYPFVSRVKDFCAQQALSSRAGNLVSTEHNSFRFDYIGGEVTSDTGVFSNFKSGEAPIYPFTPVPEESDGYNSVPEPGPLAEIEGPILAFDGNFNLQVTAAYDSFAIEKASGLVMLHKGIFMGYSGIMDWTKVGLEANEFKVELNKFQWDLSKAQFVSDNAYLLKSSRLKGNTFGYFEFKSIKRRSIENSQYPKFSSYLGNINHYGIVENVDMVGGLTLEGPNLAIANYYSSPARLVYTKNGKKLYRLTSPRFDIDDSVITADFAKAILYVDKDSITHQGVSARLLTAQNQLRLRTDVHTYRETPFFDTHHKMEITCDEAWYRTDSLKIEFRINSAPALVPAVFVSTEYFNNEMIKSVKGFQKFDPLVAVLGYEKKSGSPVFSIDELANDMKEPVKNVEMIVKRLVAHNFVDYDPVMRRLAIRPKMRHFYLSRLKKKDYDYLAIYSTVPSGVNAIYDINTANLRVYGVDKFYVSDSLNVFVEPANKDITILKNRDIRFDGKINAGAFLTSGKRFEFSYNEFAVKLSSIDSISLNIDSKGDTSKEAKLKELQANSLNNNLKLEQQRHGDTSNRENTAGILYINRPDNKSGGKKYKQYPILDVQNKSFVYFDRKNIAGGSYNENVYFDVPPFNVDSANSASKDLKFEGRFNSDDIFPSFKEKLTIQKDNSLGFLHKVPKEGYQIYKGEGKFFGQISLNGKGIRGKGEIHYLGTVIKSNNFKFFQDSVLADGKSFEMKPGNRKDVSFPDVKVGAYKMRWLPKQDSMILTSKSKDFQMYNGTTQLEGQLIVRTVGVAGIGTVKRQGSKVSSNQLSFKEKEFSGKEATFLVESGDSTKPSVRSTNVKFDYDLEAKKAVIEPEVEGEASNEFPYLSYKTSIGKLVWDSDAKIISMTNPDKEDISNSYFYSTAKGQDSLHFNAQSAVYDIEKNRLKVQGVPFVVVADARVYPDSGTMEIEGNANIKPLQRAKVVLDTLTEYHNLSSATVQLKGRYSFDGSADYNYATPTGDTLKVKFNNFAQNYPRGRKGNLEKNKGVTEGTGIVGEDAPLIIAPGVLYKGNVKMIANKQSLQFEGFVALNTKQNTNKTWLPYTNVEGKEFSLDLAKLKDANGNPITNGLFISTGENKDIYATFVSPTKTPGDIELFNAEGKLSYDQTAGSFKIGEPARLDGSKLEGNILYYNDNTGISTYEGTFNLLQTAPGNKVKLKTAGIAKASIQNNEIDLFQLFKIDYPLPSAALKAMESSLKQSVEENAFAEAITDNEKIALQIASLEGNSAGKAYKKANETKATSVPLAVSAMGNGIVLSEVQLKWSASQKAFYSVGKIGVSNINKTEINAFLDGALEIKKTPNGDIFNLYIEAGEGIWYFFSLNEGLRLSVTSGEETFSAAISAKSQPVKAYGFSMGSGEQGDRNIFLSNFFQTYFQKIYTEGAPLPNTGNKPEEPTEDDPFGGSSKKVVAPKAKAEKKAEKEKTSEAEDEVKANTSAKEGEEKKEEKKKEKSSKKKKKAEKAAEENTDTEEKKEETVSDEAKPIADPFAEEPKKEETKEEPKKDEPKKEEPKKEEQKEEAKPAEVPAINIAEEVEKLGPFEAAEDSLKAVIKVLGKTQPKTTDSLKQVIKQIEKDKKEAAKKLKAEEEAAKKAEKEAAKEAEKKAKAEEKARKEAEKQAEKEAKKKEQEEAKPTPEGEEKPKDDGGGGGF